MLNLYVDADVTFCLTSGGHNVGIVNPPDVEAPPRHYRIAAKKAADRYVDPDQWFSRHAPLDGSWWPAWQSWLTERSGKPAKPPSMGNADFEAMGDAPGTYVLMK
jgi:polyhydroxyalkanoate synthase